MPPSDTLLLVVLVLITANLVLGLALLFVAWRRSRARTRADAATGGNAARGHAASGERLFVPVFGAAGSAAVPADPQTGLDLVPTWNRWLREEEARVKRYRRPATIVIVEVEGLDRLIERLGVGAAEKLVPPVAATMRRHARESDRIARLGPARFAALLPETDEVAAINYVERVRAACDLWLAAGAVSLRLALGWAEVNAGRSGELAFEAAEERLNAERRRERSIEVGPAEHGSTMANPAPAS